MCLKVPSTVLECPLRFPHNNDVWLVFTSSVLYEVSCLIFVICVCLRVVGSNTYCAFVLFFFVLRTICYKFIWTVQF